MPMWLWPSCNASRSESSRTFLARGVNGGEPPCWVPVVPTTSATFSRTASREIPCDARAMAATPLPSPINPKRMCSVPMKPWFNRRASSCASTSTLRARSVKRSNTSRRLLGRRQGAPPMPRRPHGTTVRLRAI